jgi:hypothetical protein
MNPEIIAAYRFFREHAGYVVGESARCALALAKAEQAGESAGLAVEWEDDREEYQLGDNETEPPPYVLCAFVRDPRNPRGYYLASLGGIGLNSLRDPYRRVVAAEVMSEALETLATEVAAEIQAHAGEIVEHREV